MLAKQLGYSSEALAQTLRIDSGATNAGGIWVTTTDNVLIFPTLQSAAARRTWRGRRLYTAEELRTLDVSPFGPPEPEWADLWDEPQGP